MATIIKRNEPFTPSNASVSVNYSFANTRPMISSQNVNRPPQQPTPYYNTNRVNIAPSASLSTSASSSSSATASKNELQFLHKSQEMALKYETGILTKKRFKYVYYLHLIVFSIVLIQFALHYCHQQYPRTRCFGLPQIARPQQWQLIWLPSFGATLLGYFALARHRRWFMQMCFYGTFLFGLGPIVSTIILNGSDMIEHVSGSGGKSSGKHSKKTSTSSGSSSSSSVTFYGIPAILIWYMFLAICLQIHIFTMYFARVLSVLWSDSENFNKRKKSIYS